MPDVWPSCPSRAAGAGIITWAIGCRGRPRCSRRRVRFGRERACCGIGIMERFLFPTKERLVNCCSGTRRNEEFYHARDGNLNGEGSPPVTALAVPGVAILPRQSNTWRDSSSTASAIVDRWRSDGLCSLAATGMGWIALALASEEPYRLLPRCEATLRIRTGLETALHGLPHHRGIVPHFVDSRTGRVHGDDYLSTVETAWLAAGRRGPPPFCAITNWNDLAPRWRNASTGITGRLPTNRNAFVAARTDARGRFIPWSWDRLNGETVFMYVLATGAAKELCASGRGLAASAPFYGTVADLHFNNSDLGLFVFQYGLDLLDLSDWLPPDGVDLAAEAGVAAEANYRALPRVGRHFHDLPRLLGVVRRRWSRSPPAGVHLPLLRSRRSHRRHGSRHGHAGLHRASAGTRLGEPPLAPITIAAGRLSDATASVMSTSIETGSVPTWSASMPVPPCWLSIIT